MPDNLDVPAHQPMRKIAADGPWASTLAAASGRSWIRSTRLRARRISIVIRPPWRGLEARVTAVGFVTRVV
jgi:trans-aconitate 2-methyltransferase